MKHILFLLLFLPVVAFAQWPAAPNKIRLGNQTTGDGLVVRTAASPSWTPSTINNAWLAFDTVAVKLYYYDGGAWNEYTGGSEITDVSVSNDTLYITTTDSTFVAVFDDANTNLANSNLTFTGNRVHNLNGKNLIINDAGTYPTLYVFPSTDGIGMSATVNDYVSATTGFVEVKSAGQLPISATDTVTITAGRIRMNAADTRIQQVSKSNTLNRVMMIDSITERVYYRDVSSISAGGGGSGTVTSVAAGVGLTASPSPITTTGTISADTSVLASKTYVTTRGYTTGSGTTGTIPVWSSSTALGDSPLTVSSGSVIAGGTGFFRFPVGTTAQRPGTPTTGDARYNSTLGYSETYGASAWLQSAFPTGTSGQTLRHNGTSWVANSVLTNNGTDVINTGAHQATTYASPTGSCAQPAGGHFASTNPTGAIEITLPVLSVDAFEMMFKVMVGSVAFGAQTFDISLYAQQASGGPIVHSQTRVHVIGGPARYTSNIRFGHDGTNIKVWIDEIGTAWGGATTVNVVNVSFSRASGGTPSALSICSGWSISMENTGFNTVNRTYALSYQPSRIFEASDNPSVFDWFQEVKPVLGGGYPGTFSGAIQINLPDSALVLAGPQSVAMRFSVYITTTSVSHPRRIDILGKYQYSTGSWSECFTSKIDGAIATLTVRFGREGSVPVVYIGELSTAFTGLGVLVSGLQTWYTTQNIHNALVSNAWSVTTETSAFSNVTATITGVSAGALPYTTYGGYQYSENLLWDNANTRLGIGTNAPARTIHVTGEARITDLTTDTPTRIVGADADGDLGAITVGSGLSLTSGTLSATGGAGTVTSVGITAPAAGITVSGSPVTSSGSMTLALADDLAAVEGLSASGIATRTASNTWTARTITAGSGIAVTNGDGVSGNPTISRTYSLIHTTITGGSTFFGTTAERPDNDTPGSATTSAVGSNFSVSGSTIDYTGAGGALLRVEGSISFSVADDGDYYLSIYKEGTEIGATSMRISCVAGNYYSISLPATTVTGNTNDTFDLRIATVSGNSTTTMHRYGFIIERIY